MPLSQEQITHIARLARLALADSERKEIGESFSAILAFVEKLNEIDISEVLPVSEGAAPASAMRKDEQVSKILEGESSALIDAIPSKKDRWAKVRAVFN